MHRVVIYKKDVRKITGKNSREAEALLFKIRSAYNKKKGQFITYREFSDHTGIDLNVIILHLENQ